MMTVQNFRARESVLVAGWVFEPESEAVGMRGEAFEGPLVSVFAAAAFPRAQRGTRRIMECEEGESGALLQSPRFRVRAFVGLF